MSVTLKSWSSKYHKTPLPFVVDTNVYQYVLCLFNDHAIVRLDQKAARRHRLKQLNLLHKCDLELTF